MKFADSFDRRLADLGPAGLFTLTHEGELQFDLFRTRDWRRRFLTTGVTLENSWNHCVCIDTETKWPMYVLMTAKELVCSDQHTVTKVFDTIDQAMSYIQYSKSLLYDSAEETPLG